MATDPQAARVLFVQHERDDPPGSLGERAEQRGLVVDVVHARSEGYPDPDAIRAVVVLGSHTPTYENPPWIAAERDFLRCAAHEGVAVLGVCFGAQLLAEALGGGVHPMPAPEAGCGCAPTHPTSSIPARGWYGTPAGSPHRPLPGW